MKLEASLKHFSPQGMYISDDVKRCCLILAQFAFAEYSRSAETTGVCRVCNGTGKIETTTTERKVSNPWGKAPYWAKKSRAVSPSDWDKWTEVTASISAKCEPCGGKGK